MKKHLALLCFLTLITPACNVWVTDATNTPSGPYVRADRTVFQIAAENFDQSVPPSARRAIPNSPFFLATLPPQAFAKLQYADNAHVHATGQTPSVGWSPTTDLWTYQGAADGRISLGARVLSDSSLHLLINGDVDTNIGSPAALRGPLHYDGPCPPQSVFLFAGPLNDTKQIYVVAYEITELSPNHQPSPTWSMRVE